MWKLAVDLLRLLGPPLSYLPSPHTSYLLVVYGLKMPSTLKDWHGCSIAWMQSLGYFPTYLSSDAAGFPDTGVEFEKAEKKIAKVGMEGLSQLSIWRLRGLSLDGSTLIGCRIYRNHSGEGEVTYDLETGLGINSEQLLLKSLKACLDVLEFEYAIALRLKSKQALFYPTAHVSLDLHDRDPEQYRVLTNWREAIKVFSKHNLRRCDFLRSVYPLQILSEQHLTQRIGNITLREWIGQQEYRGRLDRFDDRKTLWTLPSKGIDRTKQELTEAKLLIESPIELETFAATRIKK